MSRSTILNGDAARVRDSAWALVETLSLEDKRLLDTRLTAAQVQLLLVAYRESVLHPEDPTVLAGGAGGARVSAYLSRAQFVTRCRAPRSFGWIVTLTERGRKLAALLTINDRSRS